MAPIIAATEGGGSAILHPAEHHRFEMRGRGYLFDVNAFTVLPSEPLDGDLLRLAADGATAGELIAGAVAAGSDREHARRRLERLVEERFLLPPGEQPEPATLREPEPQGTFMINVAQRCNLVCPYCYVNEGLFDYAKKPIARMADETAEDLVGRLYALFPELESFTYHFYGGEPLLNFKGIRRIVAAAESRARETGTRAAFHITTNGTLLAREVADFMDRHRFTVILSIDGDRERHDQLRRYRNGRGSYDDVARHLGYLRQKRHVKLVLSAVLREDLPLSDAFGLLERYGAHTIKAEHTRLAADDPLALDPQALERHLEELTGTLLDHYVEELGNDRQPKDPRIYAKILGLLTRTRRTFFCQAGERIFGVASNGELYPCSLHVGRSRWRLGHLDTGIDEARQRAFRERFAWPSQEGCRSCWTRHLCGGGCSAMVDRFGHEDCAILRAETEAAIAIYRHFIESDPAALYGLVSPEIVRFVRGKAGEAAGCRGESRDGGSLPVLSGATA